VFLGGGGVGGGGGGGGANRSVASQEIPRFLWNPVAVYYAYKNQTLPAS